MRAMQLPFRFLVMVCLSPPAKRVIIRFICVLPCFVYTRRSKGGRAPPFEELLRLRSFNALISFLARCWEEVLNWFDILLSSSDCRTSTGDVCLFHAEPRASDSKPIKININKQNNTRFGRDSRPEPTARTLPLPATACVRTSLSQTATPQCFFFSKFVAV